MKKLSIFLLLIIAILSGCVRYSDGEPVDSNDEEVAEATQETDQETETEEDVTQEETEEVAIEDTPQGKLKEMLETNSEFKEFADTYYSLEADKQEFYFERIIKDETVTEWSGIVTQNEANNVFIYAGDPAEYNGEDWITLMSEREELIPYVINVSIPDKEQVAALQKGDTLSVTGSILRAGSKEDPMVWMLENALILE